MQKRDITIYLELPLLKQTYIVSVSLDSTFSDVLELCNSYITNNNNFYTFNEDTLIYEKKNHQICARDLSLRTMHVQNLMWFLIY